MVHMNSSVCPGRELAHEIQNITKDSDQKPIMATEQHINAFADLISKCVALDPKHRLVPEEAAQHPFFNYCITDKGIREQFWNK